MVEDLLEEGDRIALWVRVEGSPIKLGQAEMTIMEIFRVEKGRVADIWGPGWPFHKQGDYKVTQEGLQVNTKGYEISSMRLPLRSK